VGKDAVFPSFVPDASDGGRDEDESTKGSNQAQPACSSPSTARGARDHDSHRCLELAPRLAGAKREGDERETSRPSLPSFLDSARLLPGGRSLIRTVGSVAGTAIPAAVRPGEIPAA